jgi:hypothetical protein
MGDSERENRTPYWETHIRPMFRILDHEKMLAASLGDRTIDLFDYGQVVAKADRILRRLQETHIQSIMPLVTHGGPWPDEWIALFARWMGLTFPRLEILPAIWTATRDRAAGTIIVRAAFKKPGNDSVWIQPNLAAAPRNYALYHEPGAGGPMKDLTLRDTFPDAPGIDHVVYEDPEGVWQRVDVK